jgi:NitT/TauT family transport system substrate-binding protein
MTLLRPLAFALLALVCACSPAKKAQAPKPGGLTPITFATDWRAQAEHGGFYQALASGEYARRGLDVKIVQGGSAVNVPQLLASGAVDMGMGSNDFVALNMVQEGAPAKAVAAYFQKDPQVLIAHPDQGIESIADLKGRPILISDASVTTFWVWLKARYGFTDDQVRKYTFNAAPFLSDKRAAQQGYLTSEPYTIEKIAGVKPKVFLLADEGYPSYATLAMATDKLIAENPAAVKAFVEASAKGWADYLNGDPTAANALIMKDNPEMTQDVLDQARAKLKASAIIDGGDAGSMGIGAMTDARWKTFFDMAVAQGVYPKTLDYRRAYTLQFLSAPAP